MKSKFQYVDFFMKPSLKEPLVYYITEHQEGQEKQSMFYDKFKAFLFDNFKIEDKEGIIKALDSHYIVHLDGQTGKFDAKTIYEYKSNPTFEELLKLNSQNKEDNELYNTHKSVMNNQLNNWMDQRSVFSNRNFSSRRF